MKTTRSRSPPAPMNKFLPVIAGDPATSLLQQSAEQSRITKILSEEKPGNESGELAVCTETRQEQRHNQRKRTKKSVQQQNQASRQICHSTQAKKHKLCCAEQHAEHVKEMLQAKAESPQIDKDLQERKFKNSDPIPTRPQSWKTDNLHQSRYNKRL